MSYFGPPRVGSGYIIAGMKYTTCIYFIDHNSTISLIIDITL